jgi:formate hydrogenlyase transcriptional activator
MTTTENVETRSDGAGIAQIDFGILEQRVPYAAHVAYFWETQQEFVAAVRFLETGLRGDDHCVVFGHDEANQAVCKILQERGFDVEKLTADNRLTILGGNPSAEVILKNIGAAFSGGLYKGASLIRLLGNIGWGKPNWPDDHELLAFEAKVTEAAKKFPCVVVCMYDTPSLSGHVLHHGGFETHPHLIIGPGALRENPYYVPTDLFLQRIEAIAGEIAERKRKDDALKRSQDRFRNLFENSVDAVLLANPDGTFEAANPEACRMFGRTEEEICRVGRAGLVDPMDSRLPDLLEERERKGFVRGELTFRRNDGSRFLGDVSSAFYQDISGATKASVIIRDVTERRRAESTLRDIIEGTAAVTGGDFFRSLVRHLAQALEVRYVCVTECTDGTKTRVRTLAFWTGEDFGEEVIFSLRGTPCEKVIGGEVCCYPQGLQSLFPEDEDLVALQAESYMGIPLHSSSGEILGHVVVMHDKALSDIERHVAIVRIFAARAGVELERKHAEEAVRKSEEHIRTLLDINNAIVTKLTRDELFHAICEALGRVIPFDRVALTLYEPESDVLRLVAFEGTFRSDYFSVGLALDLRDSHVGWAFLHGRPLLRRDLEAERQFAAEHRAYADGIRSMCALPLIVRGKSIGAINVASLTTCQYSEADAEFLKEVANQIAIAIDNMTSYEEIVGLKARAEAESVYLQEEIKTEHNFEEIIGQSRPLQQLLRKIEQVAPTETTVLIQGETGTGKELLARAIHDLSPRKERPLVKVNCGAIPAGLVESELFGHEKGAFTGALQRRVGRFELADGGTIFLDEVGELPPDLQAKLLRVLQEGEFERVGSSKAIKVNVRVIAATNRDLGHAVKAGSFRSDLFYRLNVFPIAAPALRERKSDIPLLVTFFLDRYAKRLGKQIRGISKDTMDRLAKYAWPGNIRELQNLIERAVVVAEGPIVCIDDSMLELDTSPENQGLQPLEDVERAHILRALAETNWVIHGKEGAAAILGINPSTLRSRIEKLGIKRPQRVRAH